MYLGRACALLAAVAAAPARPSPVGALAQNPPNNENHPGETSAKPQQPQQPQAAAAELQTNFRRDVIRRGLQRKAASNGAGGWKGSSGAGGGWRQPQQPQQPQQRRREMAHALQMVRNRRRKRRALLLEEKEDQDQDQGQAQAVQAQAAQGGSSIVVPPSPNGKVTIKAEPVDSSLKRSILGSAHTSNRFAATSAECRPTSLFASSAKEDITATAAAAAALLLGELEDSNGNEDVGLLRSSSTTTKEQEGCDPTYYDCVPTSTSSMGGHCLQTRKASPSSSHRHLRTAHEEIVATNTNNSAHNSHISPNRHLQACPEGCPYEICECYAYDETTSGISCNDALVDACRDDSYVAYCAEFGDALEAANQRAYCDTYICLQDKGLLDQMSDDGFCDYEQPDCVDCYCALYRGMCEHFAEPCQKDEYAEDYTCAYIEDVCDIAACCECNSGEICIAGYGYDAVECEGQGGADGGDGGGGGGGGGTADPPPPTETDAPTDAPDPETDPPASREVNEPTPAPVEAPTMGGPAPTVAAPTEGELPPPAPTDPSSTTGTAGALPDDCTMMIPDDAGIPVDPSGECWTSTVAIGIRELLITLGIFPQWNVDMRRCYKVCAEQTIAIGVQVPDSIPPIYNGGDYPLPLFNPNVYIQCGESGSSSENCVLSGGTDQFTTLFDKELLNQFIVFLPILLPDLPPLGNLPDDFVPNTSNLVVRGLTFANAIGHTNDGSAFNAISAAVNLSSPGSNMLFEDCIWRTSDELNPPSAAISITYHDSVHTPGSPYAGLTIKDSTFESGTYVQAAAMTNIDANDYGAGAASDGFEFSIENCQFNANTIVEDQVVRLLHVQSGSILNTCFTGNAIGSKALVSADTGSSMVYSDLFGEGNSAPAWTCDITDYSLGVAHYATMIDDVGDGTVLVTVNDCPDEGFIFDADSCPIGDGGGGTPTAPPPTAPPPSAGPPPVATEPPPTAGVTGDCKVCPDGSALTTPTRFSQRFGSTCQDLEASVMAFMEGSNECSNAQVISVLDCGCPYVPPADNPSDVSCTLCPDNFVPIPDLPVNPNDGSSTCGVFEWQARSFQGQQCRAMQATAGAACGCANPPTAPCEVICTKDVNENNESSSFDIKKSLTDAVVGDVVWKGQWLCGEILWAESVDPNACSDKVKDDLRMLCCPDEPVKTRAPRPTQPPTPSAAVSLESRTIFWTLSSLAVGFSLLFV